MSKKTFPILLLAWFVALGAGLLGLAAPALAQLPILEYRFNEVGGSRAESTGSNATPLTMRNSTFSMATDYHGSDQSGVTNQRGDYSFLNRNLGVADGTGFADQPYVAAIDALTSFTVTAWIAPTSGNAPRTLARGSTEVLAFKFDNNHGFVVQVVGFNDNGFGAQLAVDGGSVSFADASYPYTAYDFFAVSYDGTQTENNVKFYRGLRGNGDDAKVTLVKTLSLNQGAVDAVNAGLIVGSQRAGANPFLGLIDNFSIYGSRNAGDSRGALSLEQLEAARRFDLTTSLVPEPATWMMLITGALILTLTRRAGLGN